MHIIQALQVCLSQNIDPHISTECTTRTNSIHPNRKKNIKIYFRSTYLECSKHLFAILNNLLISNIINRFNNLIKTNSFHILKYKSSTTKFKSELIETEKQ